MPVLDHDTHESTVIDDKHVYGCHSLPEDLNHRMSNRCRFDLSLSDPSCTGCQHRGKGEAYDQMIRKKGA